MPWESDPYGCITGFIGPLSSSCPGQWETSCVIGGQKNWKFIPSALSLPSQVWTELESFYLQPQLLQTFCCLLQSSLLAYPHPFWPEDSNWSTLASSRCFISLWWFALTLPTIAQSSFINPIYVLKAHFLLPWYNYFFPLIFLIFLSSSLFWKLKVFCSVCK